MALEHHKLVEPRAPTPVPGAEKSDVTCRLPDDLLSEHVQRLALFAAIGAGLWAFSLLMHTVVTPLTVGTRIPWVQVVIEVLGVADSLVVFLLVRYAGHCLQTKTNIGLVFMVLNAILIAMLNTWAVTPTVERLSDRLSWITIVILITAMIVPATPRKMLATSLVAASMDPLGVWVAHLRGVVEVPSAINTLVLFMPNYVCAVVAILPSHVLQHMGRRLRQVQAMGSYHLVELLGRGGMGEVWRAEHQLLARSAAIKLIRPEMLGVGTGDARIALRRFEREAQATAALSSHHTIRVFDFGVTNEGTFYYVMELLSGRDLDSMVREFGPVPADRAVYMLRQACHSLADAHARGLVHRDIKPANIYVCRMGLEYDFIKVLDFGLVKVSDKNFGVQETLVTSNQTTTGTPAFMAPEVILGQIDVDRRADVYALGCVAYYLLTGHLVFEADTPMKMLMHHVQMPPVPPSQRTELAIPRELDDLVMACLEKDPDKRPQDAGLLFQMACDCPTGGGWNNAAAKRWWEAHLMELTGPLTLESRSEAMTRAVVLH